MKFNFLNINKLNYAKIKKIKRFNKNIYVT